MRPFKILLALMCCVAMVGWASGASATTITEVTSKRGIKAWLVEDHKLPLIALHFAFRGGVEQDPPAKQGLANLAMGLLTEGAGPYDAGAFQQQLADHSIALGFEAGRDELTGQMKMLSADRARGVELARLAITKARFDTADVERLRAAQLTAVRAQFGSPDWQGRYALYQKIFGNHPYGQRRLGSTATLAGLTRDDLKKFIAAHFARDNLVVAVAGDITPKQLSIDLDAIFGDLPQHAELAPIDEVTLPSQPISVLVPREGTQTQLLFVMPGPKRDDPDWFAAEIANYVLGGGGFESRLMQDVRDKKGLTYGIGTGLSPAQHAGLIVGEAATNNSKTAEAWGIVSQTMHHFYNDGVSEKDINAAKDYLTGSMALGLTSTDKIAEAVLNMQIEHLGIDYLDHRNDLIRKVSADDVDRVIKRWFNPDPIMMSMVGKPEGMNPTETRLPVRD